VCLSLGGGIVYEASILKEDAIVMIPCLRYTED